MHLYSVFAVTAYFEQSLHLSHEITLETCDFKVQFSLLLFKYKMLFDHIMVRLGADTHLFSWCFGGPTDIANSQDYFEIIELNRPNKKLLLTRRALSQF